MIQFHFKKFDFELFCLEGLTKGVEEAAEIEPTKKFSDEKRNDYSRALSGIEEQCEKLDLKNSQKLLTKLKNGLEKDWHQNCSATAEVFKDLVQTIKDEVGTKTFVSIPDSKATLFEQDALFGEAVNKAFPSAKIEIMNVGNCLAADLNTAAIFHLMRVTEIGLRALARNLKVKIKKMPLEYADWGKIIPEIEEKIKLKKPKSRGKKQSETLEFYHGAIGEFNAFKDIWRNNVMHTRGSYDEKEAVRVFNHVRGFMQRLAAKISE